MGRALFVQAVADNRIAAEAAPVRGLRREHGCVSIEAEHYARAVTSASVIWQLLPDLGRTLSGRHAFGYHSRCMPGGNSRILSTTSISREW